MTDKRSFVYYLHDDSDSEERITWIAQQLRISADHPVFDKVGRPFYEVAVDCTLDLDTGDVEFTGVRNPHAR